MITKRQKQVLDFITNYQKRKGYAPSLGEICKKLKIASISTAHFHISKLINLGYLEKEKNKPRAINITKHEGIVKIPIMGTIAAGHPIEAIEVPDATIAISGREISPTGKHYALRVQGDSMVNEGIFDGDIVIIRKQETADNGQTVVAIIDDNEATLKKIYRENKRIKLQPANQTMLPIYRKEVEIRGIVIKIVRNLEDGTQNNMFPDYKKKKIILGQFYTSDEIADFMVSLATNPLTARVLDSGCGEGVFIKSLLKNGFRNIKGYDIDEKNCEVVRNKFGNEIKVECLDYIKTQKEEKFDLIIGNPPYVHWNNIQENIRIKLQTDNFWKQYSNGEWDLLYAFIIWSIEKLNENGELIYIVPYNWFNSTYGSSLRKYLIDNGQFENICHFGEFKLFKDCYPNNIIFRYRKIKNKKKPLIFVSKFKGRRGRVEDLLNYIKKEFKKIDHTKYESENEDFKIFTTSQFETENLWHLATPTEKEHIDKVERATRGIKLSDYLDVGVGIISGYDKAYTINDNQFNNFSEKERKFIFPFIKAKNCKRYFIENGSYYLFVDEIKTEEELKNYPKIYERLSEYRGKLSKRYMTKNKNWWSWATIRNKRLFERSLDKPKIFVPCMDRSLKARYSYTNEKYFGSGDVLIIINKNGLRENLRYILAWLNSKIINDWYRVKGSHTGHRIRYTQSYVSQIPLRLIDWNSQREVKIYDDILKRAKMIIEEKGNKQLEEEIDNLFKKLI